MTELSPSTRANILHARTVSAIPPTSHQVPYENIGDLLKKQVQAYADKPLLIFYPDELHKTPTSIRTASEISRTYTYREFYELVCKTANLLINQGITRGNRIATVAYNYPDTVIQYFAAWLIGAVVVPINVGEDDKRIGYILENSQTKLAFVRDEFVERIENILQVAPSFKTIVSVGSTHPSRLADSHGLTGKYLDFHTHISSLTSQIQLSYSPLLEDETLIVYTSGTTGLPKGVVLTQYNILVDAKNIAECHRMTPEQRMMCVLPIHHVNGTIVTLMTPLYYGGSVVLNQKFHSGNFFERLSNEKVSVVSVVPTLLQFLIHENPDMSKYDLLKFRHIICGAGPLTVELAVQFEDRFR